MGIETGGRGSVGLYVDRLELSSIRTEALVETWSEEGSTSVMVGMQLENGRISLGEKR